MNTVAKLAIFTGSFLSFFVQPMIGRTLLPSFGGSAAVWVACLVAFQLLLLGGYGYAFLPAKGSSRGRCVFHLALVMVAAAVAISLPCWKDSLFASIGSLPPTAGVIAAVLCLTGLTSLVLSANTTVVQSWVGGGREVYHLYSIGNIGSFAGLLVYPVLIEPFVPLTRQWQGFGLAVGLYGVLLALLARGRTGATSDRAETLQDAAHVTSDVPSSPWLWVALPALSCALMTALTTFLTTDFEPIPLLWAILLAAFLLSYVIGFSKIGEKILPVWVGLAVPVVVFAAWAMLPKEHTMWRFAYNFGAGLLLLIVVCSALHAWLCRIRPVTRHLPRYYFCISLGGAIGGVATGVVAPLVFDWIGEYPLVLALTMAALALLLRHLAWDNAETVILNKIGLGLLALGLLFTGWGWIVKDGKGAMMSRERGFYGVISVGEEPIPLSNGKFLHQRMMFHGQTIHGLQVQEPGWRQKPTVYYSLNGGGIAFESYAPRKDGRPVRAAFVGMGAATLAAYGKDGDYFRFYEISPECIRAATNTNLFTFISDSAAKVDVIEGDARLKMTEDRASGMEKFDLIFLDAYSGDSIPTHLITAEAFDLYRSMLKEGGIIALHLSNWHINLWPTVKASAAHLKMNILGTYSGAVINEFATATGWAFFSQERFEPRMPTCCAEVDWSRVPDGKLLHDDCGSLIFSVEFDYAPPTLD